MRLPDEKTAGYMKYLMDKLASDPNKKCLICKKKPPVMVGVWLPDEQSHWIMGTPKNKSRMVAYALCKTHLRKFKKDSSIVEKVILEESLMNEFSPITIGKEPSKEKTPRPKREIYEPSEQELDDLFGEKD